MKAVPDTMMWVSYCTREDGYRHRLLDRARRQRVRLFVSDYILDELATVFAEELNRSARYASLSGDAVLRMAKLVPLPGQIRQHVTGDPDDDPIVQTAISAKADYLITADKVLLDLRKVQDVEIVTARVRGTAPTNFVQTLTRQFWSNDTAFRLDPPVIVLLVLMFGLRTRLLVHCVAQSGNPPLRAFCTLEVAGSAG